MIKTVLDTNILVSATFWKGNPNQITNLAAGHKISHYTTKEILDEYAGILKRDFSLPTENIEEKVKGIASFSQIIQPRTKVDVIKEDATDNKFLEAAIEANADYIVSGDKHLLKLKEFKGIKIVKAKQFLESQSG